MIMPIAPLFVPAQKIDLYAKADQSAADAVFLDLEDAVSPSEKQAARAGLSSAKDHIQSQVMVRINDPRSVFFDDDCKAVAKSEITAVILPKCEGHGDIAAVSGQLDKPCDIIAMIESAKGLDRLDEILSHQAITGIIFGNLDFALDCGLSSTRQALAYARSHLVTKARLHDCQPPLDGITANFRDQEQLQSDLAYAKEMGFGGRLCIHPDQTAPTLSAFMPTKDEIAKATAILDAAGGRSLAQYEGGMIDKPVIEAAQRLLERATGLKR